MKGIFTSMSMANSPDKVKILIVEDEAIIAEDLRFSLEELGYEVAGVCANYEDAIKTIEDTSPDFAIFDIILEGPRDGIALAAEVKEKYNIPFVFLTSHADKDTVRRAKAVQPNGYLVKPFEEEDLFSTIEIALANFASKTEVDSAKANDTKNHSLAVKDSMFVRDKYAYIKITFKDILYIAADGNYIKIHTSKSTHMIRGTLKETMEVLPKPQFFRVHRSFIVNVSHIQSIHPNALVIEEQEIPVQKELRDGLLSLIQTL